MSAYLRLNVRTHHKLLSCLLLCCIFEGSKNHDPKRKLRCTSASRLCIIFVMIPSKTIVISDQYWARVVIERV